MKTELPPPSSSVVSIRGNSIHSNGGLGIDLAPFPYSGVTGNDIGDADIGPNGYQNFPLIASVASSVSGTAITGSFNSTPSTTFTLDFYSNSAADPSGYGEGRTYLGAAIVSTDATGNVNYSVSVPGVAPVGQFVSATATSSSGSTSEFSGIGTVTAHNTSPTNLVLNSGIIDENGTFTLTVSFDDSDLLDNHTVSIHWGEGLPEVHVLPVGARTFSFNHQYLDDNPTVTSSDLYKVTVAITDDRGGSVSTAAGYASTVLADAPILYWRLAESSGTTATNLGSLGSGADGTYTSGPVLGVAGTTADGNTAVRLGDTSDSRVVKSSMAFPSTTVSVEFWEKTTATNNGHPFSYAAGSHDNEFLVAENCSRIYINDALIDTGVNVEDGNWHHFAVTWQSSDGALRVYKDGILAFSGTHQTGATLTSGGTLMLGQDQDSVGGGLDPAQRFIGSMDEVALYNGVLSAAQVQTHYNAAAQVTVVNVAPTNLAWSLNDHDINEGQSTSVSGTFADPGTLDVHTVTINWGDGAPITYTLPVGDRSFNISHQYLDDNPTATPFDNYTVSVSLSDDDSGTGSLAPSLIYGLKSRNGGAVVGSISPTNLYSFSSNGTNFTDIGAVKIGSTNIDADALAYSPTQGLFGYRIHSVANSNAAPTESTFLSINPTTAAATPIGGLIAGRVIRAATFDSADRLWVVDRLQNELLQIDPSNGQIVGTPVTITLNGNPSNIISDLAVRDDGTFIATDFTVGAVFYSLDIHTGVLTQIAADTALQATAQGSTRPTAFGIVAVGNIVFTYDAQGTDDIYKYDTAAGFSRSLVFANIVPSYNSGQGDLAIAAVNHLVTVRNVAPVIDTLSATSVFASGLVHLTGTYHDDGSQDTHSLTVDWGDGSPVSIMVPTAGLLMGTHVYSTQGNYTISVSLTDDDTGSTSASTSVVVVLGRSLSGSVYIDADNDGLRGIGESGLLGVQVQLNGVNDLGQSISVSTWTDIGGNYQFNQLRPGMYSLVEDQPAGYLDGKDTLGNLGLTSVNDQFFIDLSGEQDGSGYLFGELLPARLTGLVFDDTNDNGLFDIGEPGVPDAEVRLVGTNDLSEIVNLLGSTDANGNYRFENLRPGTYSIHNLQPGGYLDGRD